MNHSENRQYVRQVTLPSGKTIEVVYFADKLAAPPIGVDQPQATVDTHDLHVCGTCSSELVYPLRWSEAGATHWEVTLRCPNCEWSGTGVFSQDQVEHFDQHLDRGTEDLVVDLQRMTVANMEDEVERFAAALAGDLILPEDF